MNRGVKINESHPSENKQKLFIESVLQLGSQPLPQGFGRDLKAGRGEALWQEEERLQVHAAGGSDRQGGLEGGLSCD